MAKISPHLVALMYTNTEGRYATVTHATQSEVHFEMSDNTITFKVYRKQYKHLVDGAFVRGARWYFSDEGEFKHVNEGEVVPLPKKDDERSSFKSVNYLTKKPAF